eukprot:4052675-Pyramimonas_sp.AAC.1
MGGATFPNCVIQVVCNARYLLQSQRPKNDSKFIRNREGERDPVERARHLAMELGGFSAAELKEVEKAQRKVVDDAVELAKVSRPKHPPRCL